MFPGLQNADVPTPGQIKVEDCMAISLDGVQRVVYTKFGRARLLLYPVKLALLNRLPPTPQFSTRSSCSEASVFGSASCLSQYRWNHLV